MRRLYSIDEFAKLPEQERDAQETIIAIASIEPPEFGESGRIVRYVLSTPDVGRDLHTVAASAWQIDDFLRNPVFLWAHDEKMLPIGRLVEIGDVNGILKGTVEYVERDLYPFADTVYQLVRAKYLNAVSASWRPLEWSFSRDKARPGGVDFKKVDLLEISQVPVPALPGALAEARSHGIDTGPLYDWAERLLDMGGKVLVPRDELETLRRAAKMPRPKQAAKSNESAGQNGSEAEDSGKAVADGERSRALKAKHARALSRAPKVPIFRRGLYQVAQLAYMLEQLGYCHACSEYEEEIEEDESEVPAMLGEALKQLGEALIAMTSEEVAELLAAVDDEGDEASETEARALSPDDHAYIAAAETPQARAWRTGLAVARAGRALSASNEKKLEEASNHYARAMKHHRSMADHYGTVAGHMDSMRAAHEKATKVHGEMGEALAAAKDEPEKAAEHVARALKLHRAVGEHHEKMSDTHADMTDAHQDTADSHAAMGRSMKALHRCIRSVVDGADRASDPEENAGGGNDEAAEKERAARLRRARAVQLRGHA